MTSYTKENLLPTLIAEGITLDETKKQFETALSILRNEEKILIEALTRLKRDEQFQQSKNRYRNRNRAGFARNRSMNRIQNSYSSSSSSSASSSLSNNSSSSSSSSNNNNNKDNNKDNNGGKM
tara:strand:- start:24 stop:392 length:369 start_codon:yes stop_codon:yes gene_type:complete